MSAEEPPPSDGESLARYVTVLVGTTLAYRPSGGPFDGPQADVTPLVGFAHFVSSTVALELDVGPTFAQGEYASFSFVPGLVWAFHENVYAAGRIVIPVHTEANLALFPGIGVIHVFESGLAAYAEANVWSAVARGDPDFGVALALGALYLF